MSSIKISFLSLIVARLSCLSFCSPTFLDVFGVSPSLTPTEPVVSNCSKNHSFTIEMFAPTDGWNGNVLNLISCGNTLIKKGVTLDAGTYGMETVCLDLDTSELQAECGGGGDSNGITWDINDSSGEVILSGGCDSIVSNCAPCLKSGGQNLTVYLNTAQLPHGRYSLRTH